MGRRRRRRTGGALAALGVGAVATAGVVWFLTRQDPGPVVERCAAQLQSTDWYFTPVQAEHAALVTGVSVQRGLPARAATIALATALQESKLVNIDYGDRDSLGLFQQRPSQGWGTPEQIMDPVYSTNAFYDGLVKIDGYADMEITEAAQAVQRSAFPEAYAQHETRSRAWASALTGHSPGAVTCTLSEVGDEDPAGEAAWTGFKDRILRDLGLPQSTSVRLRGDDGTIDVDATALPFDDAEQAAWTVAHWAVATASTTSAVEVRVTDQVWTRDTSSWTTYDGDAQPAGRVTVVVAPEPA